VNDTIGSTILSADFLCRLEHGHKVGRQNRSYVTCCVSRQSCTYSTGAYAGVSFDEVDNVGLLCRRAPAHDDSRTLARQLHELMLVELETYLHQQKHNSSPLVLGSKRFCRQKYHFSVVKKCKFRQKFCHKSRISVFRHPFQQCITVTAVNLFYEVLPKQFEAFGFYFSEEKKQVTAEYWVS